LAYASAHQSGYDAARDILEESLELMPSSVHLRHALARLYMWKRRADVANPLYEELDAMPTINDIGIQNEVKNYLTIHRRGRRRRK
jgi:Tfp pilus assembly protein PilF